jgi:anti-repressor protein
MNEMQLFNFRDDTVTTITDGKGNPWFMASEVCEILGIVRPNDAVRELDLDEKQMVKISTGTNRGNPNRYIINESGLYSLIFRSPKPKSKCNWQWYSRISF